MHSEDSQAAAQDTKSSPAPIVIAKRVIARSIEYPSSGNQREFRPISRYCYNLIAIETFKCPRVQVQAGSNKHRSAAIWAKMTVNFVGREAKERVRRWHIALLRSIQP
jgi:hypothetical protein